MSRFVCPRCGTSSAHPKDAEHGYCGRCHDWTALVQDEIAAVIAEQQAESGRLLRLRTTRALLAGLRAAADGLELHLWPSELHPQEYPLILQQAQPRPPLERQWTLERNPSEQWVYTEPHLAASLEQALRWGGSFTLVEVGA